MRRLLVVDDDPMILKVAGPHLEAAGFEVATAASTDEALRHISDHGLPHLAVVDINMPGRDGLELCRAIHAYSDLPIIMLTAVDDERTIVQAIEEFAEDYVTKPFRPKELAARVVRVLNRLGDYSYAAQRRLDVDERLSLDFAHSTALLDGEPISLTATETKLLHILVRRTGRAVPTSYILRRLWPQGDIFEDTLRVHVHRLRNKIEPDPSVPLYLRTRRGVGYVFGALGDKPEG